MSNKKNIREGIDYTVQYLLNCNNTEGVNIVNGNPFIYLIFKIEDSPTNHEFELKPLYIGMSKNEDDYRSNRFFNSEGDIIHHAIKNMIDNGIPFFELGIRFIEYGGNNNTKTILRDEGQLIDEYKRKGYCAYNKNRSTATNRNNSKENVNLILEFNEVINRISELKEEEPVIKYIQANKERDALHKEVSKRVSEGNINLDENCLKSISVKEKAKIKKGVDTIEFTNILVNKYNINRDFLCQYLEFIEEAEVKRVKKEELRFNDQGQQSNAQSEDEKLKNLCNDFKKHKRLTFNELLELLEENSVNDLFYKDGDDASDVFNNLGMFFDKISYREYEGVHKFFMALSTLK